MKVNAGFWIGYTLLSIVVSGCNRYQVIPDHLMKQVNEKLSYEQVKDSPETYRGQVVVWGGEVLSAIRDAKSTTVEVLEIPLTKDHFPLNSPASSRGRFLAIDSSGEIIDPAIFKEGSRITVIGEILDSRTEPLDKATYDFPVVAIRDMTMWEDRTRANYPFAGSYSYYGYGYYGYRAPSIFRGARVTESES